MIELTHEQIQILKHLDSAPPHVLNPVTKETFVLLRTEEYENLKEEEYNDSPWTQEELHATAWEVGRMAGWDDMDEYDEIPE